MEWGAVACAGGLAPAVSDPGAKKLDGSSKEKEREFWGMLSVQGTFLMVGTGIRDVLGWRASELVGKTLLSLVVAEGNGRGVLKERLARIAEKDEPVKVVCKMSGKDGRQLPAHIILYQARGKTSTVSPSPTICQVQILDSFSPPPIPPIRSHDADIFEELDTSRGSSWQYELQQLKFANQRLLEEADTFEATILTYSHHLTATPPNHSSLDHTENTVAFSQGVDGEDWNFPRLHEYEAQRSLKRSWDSDSLPS